MSRKNIRNKTKPAVVKQEKKVIPEKQLINPIEIIESDNKNISPEKPKTQNPEIPPLTIKDSRKNYQNLFNGVLALCAVAALVLSIINAVIQHNDKQEKHEVLYSQLAITYNTEKEEVIIPFVFKNTGNQTEVIVEINLLGIIFEYPTVTDKYNYYNFLDLHDYMNEQVDNLFPLILSPKEIQTVKLSVPLSISENIRSREDDKFLTSHYSVSLSAFISYIENGELFQTEEISLTELTINYTNNDSLFKEEPDYVSIGLNIIELRNLFHEKSSYANYDNINYRKNSNLKINRP